MYAHALPEGELRACSSEHHVTSNGDTDISMQMQELSILKYSWKHLLAEVKPIKAKQLTRQLIWGNFHRDVPNENEN